MWPKPQFPEDLVTFTEEILNRKVHFPCSGFWKKKQLFLNCLEYGQKQLSRGAYKKIPTKISMKMFHSFHLLKFHFKRSLKQKRNSTETLYGNLNIFG